MITTTNLLLPQHRADLHRSGLTDETIGAAGIYSERDPEAVRRLLNWKRPAKIAPAMVFRYRTIDGQLNGFARVKPDRPRIVDGKPAKYEQPKGVPLHAYFTRLAIIAIKTPQGMLVLTEGEKKAESVSQAGLPCIGLTGMWGWQQPREKEGKKPVGERMLIDDLAQIDWAGRIVIVIPDSDPLLNPGVAQAVAELSRVLHDRGATVHVLELPAGPVGPDGLPAKMGADDFLVASGEGALRVRIVKAICSRQSTRDLADYRRDLVRARLFSVGKPGIYLDRSATGTGKTTADMPAIKAAGTSLTVLQAHDNCREVAKMYHDNEIMAVAYPELTDKTCDNYEKAVRAIEAGLSASAAICPGCPFTLSCIYRSEMHDADSTAHRIATHKRASLSMADIAKGRRYITIHEDPTDILRPTAEITGGLEAVARIAQQAKWDTADAGDISTQYYLQRMEDGANWLAEQLGAQQSTDDLKLPPGVNSPHSVDLKLFGAMQFLGQYPAGDVVRICKALAAGDLDRISVRVDVVEGKGRKKRTRKTICAIWRPPIPHETIWLSDATANASTIEGLLDDRSVIDATPHGQPPQRAGILQFPVDIKKSTPVNVALKHLRGLLTAPRLQRYQRIGVICHREHAAAIKGTSKTPAQNIEPELRQRIAKADYYGSGNSRGSNDWLASCDLLIVMGTPRVPPHTIKARLILAGNTMAAARDGHWDRDYWSGITPTNKRRTIRTACYRDRDWHTAFHDCVNAELRQAMGRARSICDNGIPCLILACEPLGASVADEKLEKIVGPMGKTEYQALRAVEKLTVVNPITEQTPGISELTVANPIINTIGNTTVSTSEVGKKIGKQDWQTRKLLSGLADRGLVERIGQRGGWRLVTGGGSGSGETHTHTPTPSDSAGGGGPGGGAPGGPGGKGSEATGEKK